MAAVIRPVGIQQFEFREGGIAPLGIKMRATADEIVQIHRERILAYHLLQRGFTHLPKSREHGDRRGRSCAQFQRLKQVQRRLPRFHGVDHIAFDRVLAPPHRQRHRPRRSARCAQAALPAGKAARCTAPRRPPAGQIGPADTPPQTNWLSHSADCRMCRSICGSPKTVLRQAAKTVSSTPSTS